MSRIRLNKTSKIIFGVVLVVLLAGLSYLVWTLNNNSNLAPDDSDAGSCPKGCSWHSPTGQCVGGGGCWWSCSTGCSYDSGSKSCKPDLPGVKCKATGLECDECKSQEPVVEDPMSQQDCNKAADEHNAREDPKWYEKPNNCPSTGKKWGCRECCANGKCGACLESKSCTQEVTNYTATYRSGTGGHLTTSTDKSNQGVVTKSVEKGKQGPTVTAVENRGYKWLKWSDGVTTITRTDTVNGNLDLTATFQILQYTLTYTAGTNGKITGTTPQTVNYDTYGTEVTAVPNTNYKFASWSDGVTTATRKDKPVTGNIAVKANFVPLGTYSLTYVAGANGTIKGDTSQSVDQGSSGTEVEAVPNTGHTFKSWSDGITTAKRTDKNVMKDLVVTANFSGNCGNGICEDDESASSCVADCGTGGGGVPQTGIFDNTLGRTVVGFVLILVGAMVYIAPSFTIRFNVKDKNAKRVRKLFEKKFDN